MLYTMDFGFLLIFINFYANVDRLELASSLDVSLHEAKFA